MERLLRLLIVGTRWILAPIYVGMFGALIVIAAKFIQEFATTAPSLLEMAATDTFLFALSMIDLALVANLILMVMPGGGDFFFPQRHPLSRPARGWKSYT